MVFDPAEAFTPEQYAELYDINVNGTQRVNRAALPHLRKQRRGYLLWIGGTSTPAVHRPTLLRTQEFWTGCFGGAEVRHPGLADVSKRASTELLSVRPKMMSLGNYNVRRTEGLVLAWCVRQERQRRRGHVLVHRKRRSVPLEGHRSRLSDTLAPSRRLPSPSTARCAFEPGYNPYRLAGSPI